MFHDDDNDDDYDDCDECDVMIMMMMMMMMMTMGVPGLLLPGWKATTPSMDKYSSFDFDDFDKGTRHCDLVNIMILIQGQGIVIWCFDMGFMIAIITSMMTF